MVFAFGGCAPHQFRTNFHQRTIFRATPHNSARKLSGRLFHSRIIQSFPNRLFSGRYPCGILCLFGFCLLNKLLSAEPETRVHHAPLLYHNFACFSISFGFFGAQQNRWVSSSFFRPPFDKLLKCPAFYQFLGANKYFVSNQLREFNFEEGLLS